MSKFDLNTTVAGAPAAENDATRRRMMAESGRNLNFIGNGRLVAVLGAAVRHAVKRTFGEVDEQDLARVADVTQRGFIHLLKNNGKAVRGLPVHDFVKEVEETKNRILRQREQARLELKRVTKELVGRQDEMRCEREAFVLDQQADSETEDKQLTSRLKVLFDGMEQSPELEQLRDLVEQAAIEGVQKERSKALQGKLQGHDTEVANYQRRISKLTDSLSRTESEISRLAGMKDVDAGVSSIYRTVQGISLDDDNAESKKEMMMAIFEANLSLQDRVA